MKEMYLVKMWNEWTQMEYCETIKTMHDIREKTKTFQRNLTNHQNHNEHFFLEAQTPPKPHQNLRPPPPEYKTLEN